MKTLTTTLMALALLWPLVVEAQQPRIGPSYDCGMPAVRQQPLAQVICSDDKLRRLDLMYVNVYAALLEQLGGSEKQKLREEANAFVAGVRVACRIPSSGWLEGKASQILLDCVAGRYVDQRAALRRRLANEALQESFLDPEEIIGIQLKLKDLGFLPDDAVADGLVGPITRQAISRWQASQNAKVTGYASQDMHVSLGRPGVAPQLQALPSAPSAARLTAIEEAFATCVDSEAKNGSYSSRDGGKSALRLMGQWHCRPSARR